MPDREVAQTPDALARLAAIEFISAARATTDPAAAGAWIDAALVAAQIADPERYVAPPD